MEHAVRHRSRFELVCIICLGASLIEAAPTRAGGMASSPDRLTYQRQPVSFERNLGQADPVIRYVARGLGYHLLLDAEGATLATVSSRLRLEILGSSPRPKVEGLDPLSGRTHYYLGRDPSKWISDVPHFGKVRYSNVYPGVDLDYYASSRDELEFDFRLAPGADAGVIRMAYEGADHLEIDGRGDLLLHHGGGGGVVRQLRPVIYQEWDGTRHPVEGSYVLERDDVVRFDIGPYDRERVLVIDPVLRYASFIGGNFYDHALTIGANGDGKIFVAGETNSTDFPLMNPVQDEFNDTIPRGDIKDTFVTVLDPEDNSLVYSTYFGGRYWERPVDMAVDAAGNAYVTGWVARYCAVSGPCPTDLDFPTTPGAFMESQVDDHSHSWIAKFGPSGNIVYATYLKGTATTDEVRAIAVNSQGEAYVTGQAAWDCQFGVCFSSAWPVTPDAYQSQCVTETTCPFVTILSADGTSLVYSTVIGEWADGKDIAVDSAGNAYVTGIVTSGNYPVTSGAFQGPEARADERWQCPVQLGCNCYNADGFVTKINPNLSGVDSLVYSTFLGSEATGYICEHSREWGVNIAVDADGNAYVAGIVEPFTTVPNFPLKNPLLSTFSGGGVGQSGFITKLDPDGAALVYSTYSPFGQNFVGLSLDAQKSLYLVTWPEGSKVNKVTPAGDAIEYQFTIDPDYNYATYRYSTANAQAVNPDGTVYVAGRADPGFPATSNAFQPLHGSPSLGISDGYIAIVGDAVAASVAATKSVSGSFVEGGVVTYRVVLSNTGAGAQGDNPGDEFSDTLPPGLTLGSVVASSGTFQKNGNNVRWNGAIAASGSVELTMEATIEPGTFGNLISNQGTVNFDGDADGVNDTLVPTDDPAVGGASDPTVFSVVAGAWVSGTKTASGNFTEGSTVTYKVILTNTGQGGQGDNPGHEFTDTLPTELSLVSASASSGLASTSGNTVHWDGALTASASVTITIEATVLAGTSGSLVANQGTLEFDSDADGSNEASTKTDEPNTPGNADPTVFLVFADATDFYTLEPCRLIDTRDTDGPRGGPALIAGKLRTFSLHGLCGIPSSARAISVNIAVTGATTGGNLRLHPGGTSVPLASAINYTASQTRSNNAVIPLNGSGELAVFTGQATGTVHFILDVNGYFGN